jgi:glycerol-3-phosphate O-acyltransferase
MSDLKNVKTVPDYLKSGDFEHIQGVLNEEPSWLTKLLASRLTPNIAIDVAAVQRLKDLGQSGPVVYAMKYRSIYDLQVLRMRLATLGAPLPAFVFGLSSLEIASTAKFFKLWKHNFSELYHEHTMPQPMDEKAAKEILEKGGAGVFFLVDEKTSRSRYIHPENDPLSILLNVQGQMNASIAVVPMFFLYDRALRKAVRPPWESFIGDSDNPGPLTRLYLSLRRWTEPSLLVGEPVHMIAEFEEFGSETDWEDLPYELRKRLIESINNEIRVNRGPEKMSRTEIKERVLQTPRVQKAVCAAGADSEQENRKKAEAYVDEIAADQRFQVHHVLYYVLSWMFRKIFDGVDTRDSEFSRLKEANTKGSIIFVCSHKSHFDYLLTGFLCFVNQMSIPHMAAGKNLSFWPVGPVLRHAAAFFIRRTFRGLSLYTDVFAAYLNVLIQQKVNINFYIEGGRSRTGKLMPPKLGMLGLLLETLEDKGVEDLCFAPNFAAYEQIPEEKSYLKELAGREKQKESFWAFMRARKILKKSFGKVYLRFHEPVSFKSFCEKAGISADDFFARDKRRLVQELAYYLMYCMAKSGVVTAVELAAAAIVGNGMSQTPAPVFSQNSIYLAEALKHNNIELGRNLAPLEPGLQEALAVFYNRKFLFEDPEPDRNALIVNHQRKPNLFFYKNALLNYIWPESFVSLLLLANPDGLTQNSLESEFGKLKTICLKEIIYNPLEDDATIVERTLNFFRSRDFVTMDAQQGVSLKNVLPLKCYAGLFQDIALTYKWVLERGSEMDSGRASHKTIAKQLMKLSQEKQETTPRLTPPIYAVIVGAAMARFGELGIMSPKDSNDVPAPQEPVLTRETALELLDRVSAVGDDWNES